MNKAALVTGASRGLGRALAERLARAGWRVVMVARGGEPLERAAAALRDEGHWALALAADVADDETDALVGRAQALAGPIDVLINNASDLGATPLARLADTQPERLARVFAVNVMAPFRLTRSLVGGMQLRARGVVVNISSDAAVEAYPGWGGYGASKAALDHLSRIWASELEGSGVTVVAVDPGEMNTAMHAAALPEADPSTLAEPASVAARIVTHIIEPAWLDEHPKYPRPQSARLSVSALAEVA